MIPDAAVEAGDLAYRATVPTGDGSYQRRAIRAAIEAAAPHMLATQVSKQETSAHSMHAEGEYFYACEACSGLPDGDRQ